MTYVRKRSPFWYLLPIFLGFVGGIISYFILKNTDQQKAKRCIIVGIIFSIPFASWFGLKIITATDNPFYVVSGGNMVPELQVYDVIIIQGNIPFEEIKIGDIIVFDRPSGHDRVIVNRVAAIIDDEPFTIRAKGDANPASIPGTDYPITEDEYIGKVVYVLPQVGYITRIMQPPANYIIIPIFLGIVILILGIGHHNYRKSLNSKITPPLDDTQFWVCPNCGSDTQLKDGRQYCPSCKIYLSI